MNGPEAVAPGTWPGGASNLTSRAAFADTGQMYRYLRPLRVLIASAVSAVVLSGRLSDACEKKYGDGWSEVTDRAVQSCEYGGLVRKSHPSKSSH